MTTRPIALITGGSRGLGRNTALHLARKGVDVVLTYRSRVDEAKTAIAEIEAAGGRAAALELDTGTVASFPVFVETLKKTLHETWQRDRFDYLVNNAGIGLRKPIAETTEEEFDSLMNIHLKGVFFLTQALLPLINDGGRIINVSSGLARFSVPGSSAYAMMKGGVEVFTRYLAKELAGRRITANTVAPGAIATDFNGGHVRDDAEINRVVAGMTALGRAGVADDIGPMIASLLSDDNRWVNAQRIEVSGGMNI
ncbi:SDR family oxidoreductase [Mesorhizobium sp. M2D.F.Ca.ET.185.01.1.1]|uniref:SDR family NAD(P)-dependent oxidoreductase n=2 Tax=Mesorhizobium TaxID=68287 RepID=UPI000FC9C770|nr:MULTISPECIES: SDR family oxidoreductase [unclassified Mesorhizobium]TGP78904.1 SDR family oxidoreductase [bacterium M00.F.Ca.ET.227.01.1.1]TGP89568.1 SDR family oxidoreductase [bacterium M00.F.Ca.ET.221.01.1.1]TGP94936.1 SDR family oxidoreductase [bacterium M00.F.Ca.ET.222.01.1.1]TGU02434.1 SDR family oxidoreductase [bacterium M00.F.Ca.ET.163.01.1.1]TGU28564.1 SDR family oxidoreductase [bacterium M00.F.Ca.ET.156.01.1.1]TGU45924.1 SDR family oxidoreductase [bacterium M00.F.Ca.ET.146.01.1.1]